MQLTARTENPHAALPDSPHLWQQETEPAHKHLFFFLVPRVTVRTGRDRAALNSPKSDRTRDRRQADTKVLAAPTSPYPRATRSRNGSEDQGYGSGDASPPLSAGSSRNGSPASSTWSLPGLSMQAAEAQAVAEKSDIPERPAPASADAPHSPIGRAEDDIPYMDAEQDTMQSEASQRAVEQQPRPRLHFHRTVLSSAQNEANWPLGPAPALPPLEPDDPGAPPAKFSATLAALASGAISAAENPNLIINLPRRVAAAPQPWYSGIGNFVRTQLNHLRDGIRAVRDMIYPAPAHPSPYDAGNRPVPQTAEEYAVIALDIGLKAAENARDAVLKVADMSEFRKLHIRGLTSQYDMLDPKNNPYINSGDVEKIPRTLQQDSKPVAQRTFREQLTQAEQQAFWDVKEILKPFGHTLDDGTRAMDALDEPADFAAFRQQILDALDTFTAASAKVRTALSDPR